MDPVGSWSAYAASYNRLTGATGGFQAASASGAGDYSHHHLAAATGNTGLGSHQPPSGGVPSTTSQLLLQAAHSTATLAGQLGQLSAAAGPGPAPSPFSPGGFLSPSVGYDSVFSPLFHHGNPKPAHYSSSINVSQHRQALAQAQAQAQAAASKQSSESDLTSLRENYSSAPHPSIAAATAASSGSFFEHQAPSSSPSLAAWSHQNSAQLPSPFGILPHETVGSSSPGPTKTNASYESTFNVHFAAAQSLNHLNSQLSAVSNFNKSTSNYVDNASKKLARSQSPHVTPVKPSLSTTASSNNTFYNQLPSAAFAASNSSSSRADCASLTGNFSGSKIQQITPASEFPPSSKSYSSTSLNQQQPSCIVSTTSSSVSSKDYRISQPPSRSSDAFLNTTGSSSVSASSTSSSSSSARHTHQTEKQSSRNQNLAPPTSKASISHSIQTKAQTKVYPDVSDHSRRTSSALESSQSSPISFAMIDTTTQRQSLNYTGPSANNSCSSSSSTKILPNVGPHHNSASGLQQSQQFPHALNQQASVTAGAAAVNSYHSRHYTDLTGGDPEYHNLNRPTKPPAVADTSYSERILAANSSASQNGPDCSVVIPRRPSPLQAHSQASPLGHVPSPAYPMYNSPMTTMSSPSPLQPHTEASGNQCSNGSTRQHNSSTSSHQVTPASPLDVSVPRPSSQGSQVAYSSVITRALASGEASKSYAGEARTFERVQQHQEYPHKQNCWDPGESPHSRTSSKFSGGSTNYNSPVVEVQPPAHQQTSQARISGDVAERGPAYYDPNSSHHVPMLQDLSSCRRDPLNIVKNLHALHQQQQQQQQSCQLQQAACAEVTKSHTEERTVNKTPGNNSHNNSSGSSGSGKRRKSGEKVHGNISGNDISGCSTADYYNNRVPPPAHHNTHNSNQQTQNGGYFEFERWNLPPPPPGPGAFASQPPLHGASFVNGPPAHQHQSLMVPHPHHPHAPPVPPYFPAFSLHTSGHHSTHHPLQDHPLHHPLQSSSMEAPPVSFGNQPSAVNNGNANFQTQQAHEEQPKVIVPNIEEELGHLCEVNDTVTTTATTTTTTTNSSVSTTVSSSSSNNNSNANMTAKVPVKKTFSFSNPSSGFMASYLKFLQGNRETSPPPQKSARKNKLYQPPDPPSVTASNLPTTAAATTNSTRPFIKSEKPMVVSKSQPSYDPQDDPRYFPLPKPEERRNSFDSDDSDEEREKKKKKKEEEEKRKLKELELHQKDKEKCKEKIKEKKNKETSKLKQTSKPSKAPIKVPTKAAVKSLSKDSSEVNSLREKSFLDSTKGMPKIPKVEVAVVRVPDAVISKLVAEKTAEKPDKKKKKGASKSDRGRSKRKLSDDEEIPQEPPRRETSQRKAKEKTNMKLIEIDEDFDADDPELEDSDSDPAWTPVMPTVKVHHGEKDSSDEEDHRRKKGSRRFKLLASSPRKRSRLSYAEQSQEDSSQDEDDAPKTGAQEGAKKGKLKRKRGRPIKGLKSPLDEKGKSSPGPHSDLSPSSEDNKEKQEEQSKPKRDEKTACSEVPVEMPFKSGEFVIMKTDLNLEHPPIWRVDGKTLLQKYEPFQKIGKTLYRNISTYSGWSYKHSYQQVPVKFEVQNRMETIVELIKEEINSEKVEIIDKSMKETLRHQEHFEVYIQTLISQALDSNFLTEILQEKDEYFLTSVRIIDDITQDFKQQFLKVVQWKPGLERCVGTWPCFNVIPDLPVDEKDKPCAACSKSKISVRVQMYGQPYNSTSLEGCPPDPKVVYEKDFLLCKTCVKRVELYNTVAHQKYLMYLECAKRVAEKRACTSKDTTVILNELLADETWLNQLFHTVRSTWAEISKLAYENNEN